MTSTNFTIGINGGRNSSRVLKPPGGGHSQIFGGVEEEVMKPKSKQGISEINQCLTHEIQNETPIVQKDEENVDKDESKEKEENGENVENSAPEVSPKEEKIPAPVPQRTRIPPGGYSSGFW